MRPSLPMSATIMSPFQIPPADNTYPRNVLGKTFGPNWCNLERSFAEVGWYSTIAPNGVAGQLNGSPDPFHEEGLSHQIEDPEIFEDSSSIPWNPPTIHCPDLIATAPQMSLPWLNALLSQQSHSLPICAVLTYNDSRLILHQLWPNLRNCQCKWLLVSSSAPGTSLGSSGSPGKFLFYTGMIVSIELPNLVPQQRIDDYYVIHFLHWELCHPQ